MIFERHINLKYKYGKRYFWAKGYYVKRGRNLDCLNLEFQISASFSMLQSLCFSHFKVSFFDENGTSIKTYYTWQKSVRVQGIILCFKLCEKNRRVFRNAVFLERKACFLASLVLTYFTCSAVIICTPCSSIPFRYAGSIEASVIIVSTSTRLQILTKEFCPNFV